jgi:hypothetical protein
LNGWTNNLQGDYEIAYYYSTPYGDQSPTDVFVDTSISYEKEGHVPLHSLYDGMRYIYGRNKFIIE